MNLQLHEERHRQNIEPQGSQQVLQNRGLSFAKNAEIKCTMECQAIPSVQPLKITEKLHDIDKPNSFPCL